MCLHTEIQYYIKIRLNTVTNLETNSGTINKKYEYRETVNEQSIHLSPSHLVPHKSSNTFFDTCTPYKSTSRVVTAKVMILFKDVDGCIVRQLQPNVLRNFHYIWNYNTPYKGEASFMLGFYFTSISRWQLIISTSVDPIWFLLYKCNNRWSYQNIQEK